MNSNSPRHCEGRRPAAIQSALRTALDRFAPLAMTKAGLAALTAATLAGCTSGSEPIAVYTPAQGINQVLEGPIEAAQGHSLVMGDLNMPAQAPIPRHYHYGEEFLYVIGGSATVSRAGMADVTLGPGEGLRIAPGLVHWGKAGPEGVRAVASWVRQDGKPLREPVPE